MDKRHLIITILVSILWIVVSVLSFMRGQYYMGTIALVSMMILIINLVKRTKK